MAQIFIDDRYHHSINECHERRIFTIAGGGRAAAHNNNPYCFAHNDIIFSFWNDRKGYKEFAYTKQNTDECHPI
jgi:hypothetical protein